MARPRQVSDEEILEHARAAFIEHGSGVATSEIARRVGLSQAALFKRFGTKDALMVQALAPDVSELVGWLRAGPDDRPLKEQLLQLAEQAAQFMDDNAPAMNVLVTCHLHPSTVFGHFDVPPPVRVHAELMAWFDRAVASGRMRDVDTAKLALAIMGAVRNQVMLRTMFQTADCTPVIPIEPSDFARGVLEILWSGIAPQEERP